MNEHESSPERNHRARTIAVVLFLTCSATSSAVAIIFASPWGLQSGTALDRTIGFGYVGLVFAVPIVLAAWSILRASHPVIRLVIPSVVLFVHFGAIVYGQRLNHSIDALIRPSDVLIAYIVGCSFFVLVRFLFRWTIGPTFRGDRSITLLHLFLWTTVAGLFFTLLSWLRPSTDEFFSSGTIRFASLAGLVGSVLAFSTVGAAFRSKTGYARLIYAAILVATVSFALVLANQSMRFGWTYRTLDLLITPAVFVSMFTWCYAVLGQFGYSFKDDVQTVNRAQLFTGTFLGLIGCLMLAAFAAKAFTAFQSSRNDNELISRWKPLGIRPFREGNKIIGAYFEPSTPLTMTAVSVLSKEPIRFVAVANDAPEPGSLSRIVEISTMERVQLEGGKITSKHLEELYDAPHLKAVTLSNVPLINGKDIEMLRRQLPSCRVELR